MTNAVTIKNRWTGETLFSSTTAKNVCDAVIEAIKAGAVLRDADLTDADLRDADLRGAVLRDADLRGADLRGAVLRGADLTDADLTDADLRGAVLTDADFRGAVLRDADLRGAVLRDADLRDADLSGADLRGAVLTGADLRGADLTGADLRGADLTGADGFNTESVTGKPSSIPIINNIHRSVLSAIKAEGCKLNMSQWHECETTHCRAGWVVHLAGEGGKKLEERIGTAAAAMRIYLASDLTLRDTKNPIPRFYESDEKAMASIVAAAEREEKEELEGLAKR
jgi:hypothetical protein